MVLFNPLLIHKCNSTDMLPKVQYHVHAMAKRLATLFLLVVLSCSLTGCGVPRTKKKSSPPSDTAYADFDYFLLTLSWAPEFCATNSKGRSSAECDGEKHIGLVVHGLWPQYDNGKWLQDCATTPPVASAIVDHMMPIMPGEELIQQAWAKHGSCSGLSTRDYFGKIEKLYTGLQVPNNFKKPSSSFKTNPSDIEKEFATVNNTPKGAFRVSCPQNRFSAVEICLSKDFEYQSCPNTVTECRANKIVVRPVP
jgi:ribonuclease T2